VTRNRYEQAQFHQLQLILLAIKVSKLYDVC
jgi:hypothetical protein